MNMSQETELYRCSCGYIHMGNPDLIAAISKEAFVEAYCPSCSKEIILWGYPFRWTTHKILGSVIFVREPPWLCFGMELHQGQLHFEAVGKRDFPCTVTCDG